MGPGILFGNYTMVILLATLLYEIHLHKLKCNIVTKYNLNRNWIML